MRISIRIPSVESPEWVELKPGESVLIGRQPDPNKIDPRGAELASGSVTSFTVHSPSVSANHALVSWSGDAPRVVDLGSRNGTWLRVPPFLEVPVAVTDQLMLRLAPAASSKIEDDLPADTLWAGRADYAPSLVLAIEDWLSRRGTPAQVRLVRRSERARDDDLPGRIALPVDVDLTVRAEATMDPEWLDVLARVERYVMRQNTLFGAEEEMREEGLIIASPGMRRAVRHVVEAAERGARSLLLIGPSGSGKEGLARCFHRHTRPAGPFVSRNCGTFEFGKDLILSELFGADRGAFTGSVRPIIGAVEAADQGTLFLDEIGELPLDVQRTFLRFLDRGEYLRLGRDRPLRADVRVVGATNKDLRAACLKGEFRRDLWFRLSIQVVEVPPLSERFEDLTAYLGTRPHGTGSLRDALLPEAMELLRQHRWEGNFRELVNFVGRLPRAGALDVETCRRALAEGALHPVFTSPAPPADAGDRRIDWLALAERAAGAFGEDHEQLAPRTWDEVKDFVEGYLKPLLFAWLSGADQLSGRDGVDLRAAAERVRADRGTAAKQIDRFFVRFPPKSPA
ncbi:MAG TPA: sigma 54-interacting transcriptional regulator [Polyangia bacterium]|nr:sigma 54-interacting transcriptional regulator [Polyangia bacterium]